jgi:hypothetical protein
MEFLITVDGIRFTINELPVVVDELWYVVNEARKKEV